MWIIKQSRLSHFIFICLHTYTYTYLHYNIIINNAYIITLYAHMPLMVVLHVHNVVNYIK